MSTIYDQLETLRARFATIPNVRTSGIGIEPNISPESYPIVRVVPSRIRADGVRRKAEMLVYFGAPVHESTGGIDDVYAALFAMEAQVIAALAGNGFQARYVETIMDEDRIEHFKLMAVVAEVDVSAVC